MYDSTNPNDIPLSAVMVAGYIDGIYAWPAFGWLRFAGKPSVKITAVNADLNADVIDIESGAMSVAQAIAWAIAKHARGQYFTFYFSYDPVVNHATYDQLQAGMNAAGIHSFGMWYANWNNNPNLYPNFIAHQYANPALTGAHYDLSVVLDYWPGVDPGPPPPPPPLDAARAAWANLGTLLDTVVPGALARIAAAIDQLKKLP
jgi:hypothetical protein